MMSIRSLADFNGAPGRSGDWLAPPPSPPRAHAPGRHDERGVGTSIWPPAGTYTWPSAGTFPWPWTACAAHADRFDGSEWRDVGPLDDAAGAELDDRRARWATALAGK